MWAKGSEPIVPYGLWRLDRMLARHSYTLLLEGESDCWTGWKHGLPALGIPGKSMHGTLKLKHVEDFERLCVGIEADEGGRQFARNIQGRLREIGYEGEILALPFSKEAPDLNDLYRGDPDGFEERLGRMMDEAPKLEEWLEKDPPSAGAKAGAAPDLASNNKPRAVAGTEVSEPSEAGEALEDAPPLPGKVYGRLPSLLREAASTFGQRHERDVFLTGALASLSACMPKVEGYYGHVPSGLAPHQYVAIVAGAAGGKGALKEARRLTSKVNEYIKAKSEAEQRRWEDERERAEEEGDPFDRPEPPRRSLLLPANTSAAAFHEGLKDRDERALVIETEIDTLNNALGQEWGKFDDTLRKAYHHEPTSYRRKGEGNVTLESPALSVVLSGTSNQFQELIGSTENGLYSRFQLYYFGVPQVWTSQRPTADALRRVERFEVYAERVLSMWRVLVRRGEPLRFRMTDGQWRMHDGTFAPLLREAALEGRSYLSDVIKRAGVVAFRIAMTLTVLRAFESGAPLETAGEFLAEDVDVQIGLSLATTYADHAMRFAGAKLQTTKPSDPSALRIAVMLKGVGEEFTSGEAYDVAEAEGLDVSRRTLREDLKTAQRRKLIRTVKKGHWEKTDTSQVTATVSDTSITSGTSPETEASEAPETTVLPEKPPKPGLRRLPSLVTVVESEEETSGSEGKNPNGERADGSFQRSRGTEARDCGLERKQLVMTPKGTGKVVKLEGRTVIVELDDALIGETEAFDTEEVEPLEVPF